MRERQQEEAREEREGVVQAARGEREEGRWAGGERFTLFSDQRTEYRLERQEKERNTENKE